jgi:hypothetical protein
VQAVAGNDLTFRSGGHGLIFHCMKNRRGVKVLGIGDCGLGIGESEKRKAENGEGFSLLGIGHGGRFCDF